MASKRQGSKNGAKRKRTRNDASSLEARTIGSPYMRHGIVAADVAERGMSWLGHPEFTDFKRAIETATAIKDEVKSAVSGDVEIATRLMASQAITLDVIFAELARRAVINMGAHPGAFEQYMRFALKAQAASRATLDAMARLHQPREQTVKHVHVNSGGQAIVADQINNAGGGENTKINDQPHEQRSRSSSLFSEDAIGLSVPAARTRRKAPVPVTRGPLPGGAEG